MERPLALIVDDEPDFAAYLAMILRDHDLDVTVAHDGQHALEAVFRARPDVITLDIQMPHQSGIWFYRKLRVIDDLKDLPVVVVSGLTKGDREMDVMIRTFLERDGIRAPAAYLEKPIDGRTLRQAVDAALAGRGRDAPAGVPGGASSLGA